MHEFGVTQAALEAALERAEEACAAQITEVHLAIGTVSSIEPNSIRLYWDEIAEGTIAEDATLHFRRVPSECYCADCRHQFVVEAGLLPCAACGSEQVRAIDDEYLGLEAIDVEKLSAESTHG
jgi:hydrogenase nickel incorporation protein HypA/HybF